MQLLKNLNPENIIFIDIETVSAHNDYSGMSPEWQALWDKKAKSLTKGEDTPEQVYERAGIYAEFGRIVCIGVGFLRAYGGGYRFRVKSIYGHDEAEVLHEFASLLNSRFHSTQFLLCAHNGKEFDFPYIARRMMVNHIKLPLLLDFAGKKPWEVPHIDTMELWKFGDFKSFTSLNLLAHLFDIPTPKDDIDGSQVGEVYWKEGNLERIATYCQKDVITLARLFLAFRGDSRLNDNDIESVE